MDQTRQAIRKLLVETTAPPEGREPTEAEMIEVHEFAADIREVEDYNWRAYDAFPMSKLLEMLGGSPEEWVEWFDSEVQKSEEEDWVEGLDREEEDDPEAWDDILIRPVEYPITVAEFTKKPGSYEIWDGWHRFSGSVKADHPIIPVVLGTLK